VKYRRRRRLTVRRGSALQYSYGAWRSEKLKDLTLDCHRYLRIRAGPALPGKTFDFAVHLPFSTPPTSPAASRKQRITNPLVPAGIPQYVRDSLPQRACGCIFGASEGLGRKSAEGTPGQRFTKLNSALPPTTQHLTTQTLTGGTGCSGRPPPVDTAPSRHLSLTSRQLTREAV
jgi:hypothetical protein